MIPYGRQNISEQDIEAVVAVLRSDFITQGPAIERFERRVAEYCDVSYAVAINSATAALHIAYLALGFSPGDIGWTSPNTFVASANAFLYCGGKVDFVDIDPNTWNLDVRKLKDKLRQADRDGARPRIVTPVHFGGLPCDLEEIAELSRQFGYAVVEDASHAIGAQYQDYRIGSCRHSDVTVFSFHPVKIITTGEGGMLLTRRRDVYERAVRLRSHGITRNAEILTGPPDGPWYYEQLELGFNYRMTDIQAALGASQIERLESFIARRRELVRRYDQLLADLPVRRQARPEDRRSAHHLYPVRIAGDEMRRGRIFAALDAEGIKVNVHYIPVYRQPYYRQLGFAAGLCPEAEAYYRQAISLPLYYDLSDAQQDFVIDCLRRALA